MVGLSLPEDTQDPGIHTGVRAAIVHIIYSKMGIDQMPNFKTMPPEDPDSTAPEELP